MKSVQNITLAVFVAGITMATRAEIVAPTAPPEPPKFSAQLDPIFVKRADILEYRALENYSQPAYMDKFVEAGLIPPVKERLPKEPLVYKTANMPDGIGTYGDVMRHVIGGRPEGWNFWAGQNQGWGGIDIAMYECLTRTGPLFTIDSSDLEPLPNLAKSWEWSDDGKTLTVHLIEGAKWSDGDPFDTKDIEFYWNDVILDPEVTPLMGASQGTFGEGTTLEVIDDYSFKFNFKQPFPSNIFYDMSYGAFCPPPSHVLKPKHPKYGGESYQAFTNAFPPTQLGFPVMGAWVPVQYRPDDIIVLRRNPYYWKVDEAGQQLPYLNEIQYRLSTWADRDVQAIAGTGDISNLEQPENFVESLKRAAQADAPSRLAFGSRTIGYSLRLNLSANGWGEPDERAQAIRELNRNLDFRKGLSQAIDRERLGNSLVKGPFTLPYPGGIYPGTSYYDKASTVFYPYSIESAREHFAAAGLKDTDGDGFVNFPKDIRNGANVELTLLHTADYQTDKNIAEALVAMLEEAGLKVIINSLPGNDHEAAANSGKFDLRVVRNTSEYITVVQRTSQLASTGPKTALDHKANEKGELDLLPFEVEMADLIKQFMANTDPDKRAQLIKDYQKVSTTNLYNIGLVTYPGALIINKRFANVPVGTPILMFNWAEDSIMRERVYASKDKVRLDYELYPDTLPSAKGAIRAE